MGKMPTNSNGNGWNKMEGGKGVAKARLKSHKKHKGKQRKNEWHWMGTTKKEGEEGTMAKCATETCKQKKGIGGMEKERKGKAEWEWN